MISEKEFLNKVRNIVIPEMMEIEKERKKVSFIYWFFLVLSIVPFFIVDELQTKVILFSLLISVPACIYNSFKKNTKFKYYQL